MATLRIGFTTDLGAQVSVEAPEDALLETLRHYGRLGWFSGALPPGGLVLPYDNEQDFDWSLLGGRRLADGSVWCRGQHWERQEVASAILYSRLAKPSDPLTLRQSFDGERERVTLAVFRGGERQEAYALPAQPAQPAPQQQTPQQQEVVQEEVKQEAPQEEVREPRAVPEGVLKMWANIGQLLTELEEEGKLETATRTMASLGYAHEETEDIDIGRRVYRELRALLK